MLTHKELLQELESLGNEQTRKTYRRHGVGDKQFGVSYANLGRLQNIQDQKPKAKNRFKYRH